MSLESDVITNVGLIVLVVSGTLYFIQLVDMFGTVDIPTIAFTRRRIFRGLVQSSPPFAQFFKFIRSPENHFSAGSPSEKRAYSVLALAPILTILLLIIEAWVLPPLSESFVYLAIPVLVLGYVVAAFALSLALSFARRKVGPQPSNFYLLLLSYLNNLDSYTVFMFFILVFSPLKEFSSAVSSNPKAADDALGSIIANPTLALILLSVLLMFFAMFLLFRRIKGTTILAIQDGLYQAKFAAAPLAVEVTLRSRKGEDSRILRGSLLHIGSSLVIGREDGFLQSLPWKEIRFVAARS